MPIHTHQSKAGSDVCFATPPMIQSPRLNSGRSHRRPARIFPGTQSCFFENLCLAVPCHRRRGFSDQPSAKVNGACATNLATPLKTEAPKADRTSKTNRAERDTISKSGWWQDSLGKPRPRLLRQRVLKPMLESLSSTTDQLPEEPTTQSNLTQTLIRIV
jgi:hypothetical protein